MIIQEHSYFALSIMDRRFPVLAKKIFKFMGNEYQERYSKIQEVTSDKLYTNMEKIVHDTGRKDDNELQKLNPFHITELKEYIDTILNGKDKDNKKKEEDKYILPRMKKKKRYKPRKMMLSYVDECVEEHIDSSDNKGTPKTMERRNPI